MISNEWVNNGFDRTKIIAYLPSKKGQKMSFQDREMNETFV
jgi:hypothetical protein